MKLLLNPLKMSEEGKNSVEDLKLHDEICRSTSIKRWFTPFSYHHGIVTKEGNEEEIRITHVSGIDKMTSIKRENETLKSFMDGWLDLYKIDRKHSIPLDPNEINENLIY